MVAVVETKKIASVVGGHKIITIETDAACETSHTIDLNSDVADGRAMRMEKIINTLVQDDAGADKTCTWDPDTGIITMGTLTTGIHHITVIGR